jgi:hypothetical protein
MNFLNETVTDQMPAPARLAERPARTPAVRLTKTAAEILETPRRRRPES